MIGKARAVELASKFQRLPKHFPENSKRLFIREGILYIGIHSFFAL